MSSGAPLWVLASVRRVDPFQGRWLVAAPVRPDGGFSLQVEAPPEGYHLWAVVDLGEPGPDPDDLYTLYNYFPLGPQEPPGEVHFTTAEHRLMEEGLDPLHQVILPWWPLFLLAPLLALLGGLSLRRLAGLRRTSRGSSPPCPTPRVAGGVELALLLLLLLLATGLRLPGLGESWSMTEFVHARMAASGGGHDHQPVEPGEEPGPVLSGGCPDLCDHLLACALVTPAGFWPGERATCVAGCQARLGAGDLSDRFWDCASVSLHRCDAQPVRSCLDRVGR